MGEKDEVFDVNDPKNAETMRDLEIMNKETADTLTCWDELYTRLQTIAKAFAAEPSQDNAFCAVAVLISFVLALRELPEEGDVVIICRKLNEIMVTRSDLTGIHLLIGKAAEKAENAVSAEKVAMINAFMEGVAAVNTRGAYDTPQDTPPKKPLLH